MAEKLTAPPSGLSFAAVNPAGLSAEDLGGYLKNLADVTDALAHRYDNPNWFNVAAGFFKPQLGGFAASLGSAGQALGENVEQQRANIAPVAQMRAEMGRMGFVQKQKQAADALVATLKPGEPVPADVMGKIAQLDPKGPAEAAANAINEEWTRKTQQSSTQAGTEGSILSNQAFMSSNPWLKGAAESVSNIDQKTPEQVVEIHANLNKSRPMSIDPITWAGMLPKDKLDQINNFATVQQDVAKEEEGKARDKATAAQDLLPHLLASRNLVVGNGPNDPNALAPLLGKLQGPEFFDAIAREVDKNGMTNGGYSAAIANMLKDPKLGATPEQINRVQVLVKDLAAMQADRRDTASNPTNLYQTLRAAGSPTADNTGNAIVRMFDMMALGAAKEQDSYSARIDSKMDARHLPTSGPLRDITALHSNMRKDLAASNPTVEAPSFYTKPTFWDSATRTVPKATSPAETAAPAASKFVEGKVYTDAKGNKAKFVNGNWEPQ